MKHLLTLFVVGTLLLCANAQSKLTFRFAHGIPDAGPVDVRVEGKLIFDDVKFGTVTRTVFISSSEALNVTITTALKKTTLLTDLFTFTQPLTVAAIGTLSSEAMLVGYLDFPNVTPEKKNSAVRAINLIVNSPELAVRSTKVIGGSNNLLAETVPFPAATLYEIVPATIYNLLIATAEGNNNLIYKPGVTFAPLNYYTIFLFGDYTSGSASKTAEDAARQGNFAPVGAAKNLFLNIVNDAKQLLPVDTTYDEL